MGCVRHCWKCERMIFNKSYVYCSLCRQKEKKPRMENNNYPYGY